MIAPIAWAVGIGVSAYLLFGRKKKKKPQTALTRRDVEIIFGRTTLAAKQCGTLSDNSIEKMNDIRMLEMLVRQHCPQVFEVPEEIALAEGRVMLQALETAFGMGIMVVEQLCPDLQIDALFVQFNKDLLTPVGPLGAVSEFRQALIVLCPGIEAVPSEEFQRVGKERLIAMGIPAT